MRENNHRRDHKRERNIPEENNTLIQGRNAVLEAIESDRDLDKILIKDGEIEGSLKMIVAKAKEKGIKI